ncbi:sensor histidine kinase [Paenibacillus caseinilyticus]|uniref:histidine kinase n=1 Tax=Paenibacillus mucilaginosus K02 TaxID=997761 RepID=I0BCI0_9BACL|nr:HAMP domain-containing sensor histidine kinase [Paenibacillus mucilaginosus]AFH60077.1 histidine kinase [Paenibacillus mucilaginosus K02]
MNRLHTRFALLIVSIAAGILLISTVSIMLGTHYHLSMYQGQTQGMNHDLPQLDYHLEQALLQSILWTFAGSVILSVLIAVYTARRLSAPLVDMKRVAEQMTDGQLDVRARVRGRDELAELGASLNKLAEQLSIQNGLRKTMTEDIAHELRTPLTTLKSHMRAFEDGVWEPTPERIHSCYEEIERLTRLVAELEELTYMESPEFRLECTDEKLHYLLANGVELVSAAYLEKKVELSLSCPADLELEADRGRITQILVNLLSNALAFTPQGGAVRVHAEESFDHGKPSIHLRVEDTGTGIPEEDLPYIFERLYRGEKSRSRRTGGSGLGLTIVKRLVAAHGGQVWAENGQGAVFHIRLPRKKETSQEPSRSTQDLQK